MQIMTLNTFSHIDPYNYEQQHLLLKIKWL